MKYKYALAVLPVLFLLAPVTAFAGGETYTRTPAGSPLTVQPITTQLHVSTGNTPYNCQFNGGSYYYFEITDSNSVTYDSTSFGIPGTGNTTDSYTFTLPAGTYVSVYFICTSNNAVPGSIVSAGNHNFSDSFVLTDPPPAGLPGLISTATTTFASTTGFTVDDGVQWAGTNLIKLFLFSGLAVLYNLRGWIVALLVIASIIYFSYRAFRFFRH